MTEKRSNNKAETRRRVQQAQAAANAARAERDRANLQDVTALVEAMRELRAVDAWEAQKLKEATDKWRAAADKRRASRRGKANSLLTRLKGRRETLATIAAMSAESVGQLRAVSRYAPKVDKPALPDSSRALGGVDDAGSEKASDASGSDGPPAVTDRDVA
ncbi:MAG: hypothetical protein K0U84_08865 [Actinomycetia bacterium]|nr:hypothetical protein [Actinomycetes bacterium]